MAETDQTEIEEQLAVWEARGDGKTAQEEPRRRAKVIQLPLWPESKRGTPNAVLRGALFAAIQGKTRVALDRELLTAQQGLEIRFTGWQLSQSDLEVWEQVLHLARTQALGTRCYFNAHGFLKALGRQTGASAHEWLKSAIARLTGRPVVEITSGGRTYFGTLIEGGARDEHTGRYVVEINAKLAAFYGPTQWTQLDWEQRQQLRGKPLALVAARLLCQPRRALPADGRVSAQAQRQPDQAAPEVQAESDPGAWELVTVGAIQAFEIVGDLVHVRTVPSKSQQKHLAARRPPARRRK